MSQLDLNGVISAIRTILLTANTSGGSPIDLSANLTNRVSAINNYSPTYIEPGRDKMPAIHVWLESKDVSQKEVSINQVNGRREATLRMKVAGFVVMDTFLTQNINKSEEELRTLMENIERVLRSNDKFTNTVDRQRITNVTYFDLPYADSVAFKAAVMDIEARKLY